MQPVISRQTWIHSCAAFDYIQSLTPSRWLVYDIHIPQIEKTIDNNATETMTERQRKTKEEGRKKGKEGRGGLHQLFGKNAQEVTFFSTLPWPDLCYIPLLSLLQWKCPTLGKLCDIARKRLKIVCRICATAGAYCKCDESGTSYANQCLWNKSVLWKKNR